MHHKGERVHETYGLGYNHQGYTVCVAAASPFYPNYVLKSVRNCQSRDLSSPFGVTSFMDDPLNNLTKLLFSGWIRTIDKSNSWSYTKDDVGWNTTSNDRLFGHPTCF